MRYLREWTDWAQVRAAAFANFRIEATPELAQPMASNLFADKALHESRDLDNLAKTSVSPHADDNQLSWDLPYAKQRRLAFRHLLAADRPMPFARLRNTETMNKADENRLQFVANEINLGFTLIESARLAFSMAHTEHGESAFSKAEDAYRGAHRFLGGQSGDVTTDSLQDGVNRLRAALDDFRASLEKGATGEPKPL